MLSLTLCGVLWLEFGLAEDGCEQKAAANHRGQLRAKSRENPVDDRNQT
jgi:hypothetical protein